MKFVFLNGKMVASESAAVPIFDRSFLYGDGLFETVRVTRGQPQLWEDHWKRFSLGAQVLRIALEYDSAGLLKHVDKLLEANVSPEAILRIQLSRGVGSRGYSPAEAKSPVLVMSTYPLAAAPASWNLAVTSFYLPPLNRLSAFKTNNRLLNVLAKAEAEDKGADEGLLLTKGDHIAEGTGSNIFWIQRETVCTPPEQAGIVPGVMRAAALRACDQLGIPVRQTTPRLETLLQSAGVFMTLSTFGVIEAITLDGKELSRSPITAQIRDDLTPKGDQTEFKLRV